jgi:hypothetical protein
MENARTRQRISAFNDQHFENLNCPTLSIILRQYKYKLKIIVFEISRHFPYTACV